MTRGRGRADDGAGPVPAGPGGPGRLPPPGTPPPPPSGRPFPAWAIVAVIVAAVGVFGGSAAYMVFGRPDLLLPLAGRPTPSPSGTPQDTGGPSAPPAQVVGVVGEQFSWTFTYKGSDRADTSDDVVDAGTLEDPPDLYLMAGRPVEFELTSRDVVHSFFIPAFVFKEEVLPGTTRKATLTPTKRGTFAGKCAELCGSYHTKMVFRVHVVGAEAYEQKLAELRTRNR